VRIGLVRHFKVKHAYPKGGRISAKEISDWFRVYDQADIEIMNADLGGIQWEHCYASDMPRASRTAEIIYDGGITPMKELRELPPPQFRTGAKLPFIAWAVLIRVSWLFNRQTREDIRMAKIRINKVLDQIAKEKEQDVLIVSHAALMLYMRKELLKRGFSGPKFQVAENGKLYVFRNE